MSTALLSAYPSAPVFEQVIHILVESLEHIRSLLQRQPLSDDNVHTIRKELKRARAGLRLLREVLGVPEYRRLNSLVRDAAVALSTLRDVTVLLQTLDNVVEQIGKPSSVPVADTLRHALQQELAHNRAGLQEKDIAVIRQRLNAVVQGLHKIPHVRLDHADIDAAIKRAHNKARKAFDAAQKKPDDTSLHEWRKQVKYEFNQLELLRPLKPKRIGAFIRQAHKLSDYLGDDHDLAILQEKIAAQNAQAGSADTGANAGALLEILQAMRTKLQKKARRIGKRLHKKKTGKKILLMH